MNERFGTNQGTRLRIQVLPTRIVYACAREYIAAFEVTQQADERQRRRVGPEHQRRPTPTNTAVTGKGDGMREAEP